MEDKFNKIMDTWEITSPTLSKEKLYNELNKPKVNFWNVKKISVSVAACLIIALGLFYFNNEKPKEDIIFDGSNSDLICYTILYEE